LEVVGGAAVLRGLVGEVLAGVVAKVLFHGNALRRPGRRRRRVAAPRGPLLRRFPLLVVEVFLSVASCILVRVLVDGN
jgi:hypothetical protein